MTQKNRRNAGTGGAKAFIAAASVAATLAGWALLPANDPPTTAAAGAAQAAITQPTPTATPGVTRGRGSRRQPGFSGNSNSGSSGATIQPFSRSRSSR